MRGKNDSSEGVNHPPRVIFILHGINFMPRRVNIIPHLAKSCPETVLFVAKIAARSVSDGFDRITVTNRSLAFPAVIAVVTVQNQ